MLSNKWHILFGLILFRTTKLKFIRTTLSIWLYLIQFCFGFSSVVKTSRLTHTHSTIKETFLEAHLELLADISSENTSSLYNPLVIFWAESFRQFSHVDNKMKLYRALKWQKPDWRRFQTPHNDYSETFYQQIFLKSCAKIVKLILILQ